MTTQYCTATATVAEPGPLRQVVLDFNACQARILAAGVKSAADWQPMDRYIDTARFKRVGAYLEELDFAAYCDFLAGWAAGGTHFEFTEFHVTEVGNTLFQEIEERHRRGDQFIRKNVIAVYRFGPDNRIVHLDIYEQAKDSGDWIKDAAKEAVTS
jgi:hypothetical protein